jgi:pimeloyl-ACP methyl ester carboxylesterase
MRRHARTMMLWIALITALGWGNALRAQDITGYWQGTLHAGQSQIRIDLKVSKMDNGNWSALIYNAEKWPQGTPVNSFTLQDSTFTFSLSPNGPPNGPARYSFEGKLSADGNSISGTFTHEGSSMELDFQRATANTALPLDTSPHTVQFVTVQPDVKLEVLDWGGTGRALIFLTGLGLTAHEFDDFAPKFTAHYHVYGITRRGFGASSVPTPVIGDANGNYSSDRLGDDVLVVMAALKLNRPVLIGHSQAGEELSSIGSRYPEKVAGLIYLDAGFDYAYWPRSREKEATTGAPPEAATSPKKLETTTPRNAIAAGVQKYTKIPCPILAIFAVPHAWESTYAGDAAHKAAAIAADQRRMTAIADAFEAGLPSAHVVRLANADHALWTTNESDVLREMNAFLSSLL